MSAPNFWDDKALSKETVAESTRLKRIVEAQSDFKAKVEDLLALRELRRNPMKIRP